MEAIFQSNVLGSKFDHLVKGGIWQITWNICKHLVLNKQFASSFNIHWCFLSICYYCQYKIVIFKFCQLFYIGWHPTIKNFPFLPSLSWFWCIKILLDSFVIFQFFKMHYSHYWFRSSKFLDLANASSF